MALSLEHEPGRIYAKDDAGKVLAQILFPACGEGLCNFTETFVDPSLRGQGAADQLVRAAVSVLRARGMRAIATCSYVRAWFAKHPEEADLLLGAEDVK